jgi:hypothetical protein
MTNSKTVKLYTGSDIDRELDRIMLQTFEATLRTVGRVAGEQTVRFKASSLEQAADFADGYVYKNRNRFSKVLKIKAVD